MSLFNKTPLQQILEGKHYTSKDMSDYYKRAIDDAIEIVREELNEVEKHSPTDSVLKIVVIKLRQLQTPNPTNHE